MRGVDHNSRVSAVQQAAVRHVEQAMAVKHHMAVLPGAASSSARRAEAFGVAKTLSEGLLAAACVSDGVKSGVVERTCASAARGLLDLLDGDSSSAANWLRGRALLASAFCVESGHPGLLDGADDVGVVGDGPYPAGDPCAGWAAAYVVAACRAAPPGYAAFLEAAAQDAKQRADDPALASTRLWTLAMNAFAFFRANDTARAAESVAAFDAAGGAAKCPGDDYPLWLASYVDAARGTGGAGAESDPTDSPDAMLACSMRCA